MSGDAQGDRERDRFVAMLGQAQPGTVRFWWRDDDAVEPTPALDRLLELGQEYAVPVVLAVIPEPATADLAARLAGIDTAVLQHGWRHKNHSPAGQKKMELGDHRPAPVVLEELRAGFARLSELFPATFLPILVPPWNRIGPSVEAQLGAASYLGISLFGPSRPGALPAVNTHVDIIEWHPVRRPKPRAQLFAELCRELEGRLAGNPEPVGILSHHLVHEDASWAFLNELFELTCVHRDHAWTHAAQLFTFEGANAANAGAKVERAQAVP